MWNKNEEEPVRAPVVPQASATLATGAERRETAGIGASITIVGDVTGDEDFTILGRLEGKIDLPKHSVTVGQGGRVKADIHAKSVSVAGEVTGNVVASEQVVIRKTATMLGNLAAPRVGLEDGCRFRGSVEMETPSPKGRPASAPIPSAGGGTAAAGAGTIAGAIAQKPEPAVRS